MSENELFKAALGLTPPWEVLSIDFSAEKMLLMITIDFPAGSTFECPECGKVGCKAYDTKEMSWRHLNFFQHETQITARVPRVECSRCGVKKVKVPWSRPGSGFTLLFEAMVMILSREMTVKAISRMLGEHDTRIWRILNHHVEEARQEVDCSQVEEIGVDETSIKRGHNYVTLFVDMAKRRVLFATKGKDSSTLESFTEDLQNHNGSPEQIQEICMDMSPGFIRGAKDCFPKASITFDKFHVMKIINTAVDAVRREERKDHPELAKTRYLWLKNPKNLTQKQLQLLEKIKLKKQNLKTVRAYHIRLNFQEFWRQPADQSEAFLKKWYFWATHSRLAPIIDAAHTIKKHWKGILRWFTSKINNGVLEGINSLIQAAKTRARGYRSSKNFITIIYMISGKLNLKLPT